MLDNFRMVVAAFSMTDEANPVKFFEKTFLVANVNPEVVLAMFFFTLSSTDVNFLSRELRWRTYTTKEALPTTKRVELVGKKKFAIVALDPESETFVVYIVSFSSDALPNFSLLNIYPFNRSHISGLIAEEAFMKVSAEYSDFADVFSPDLASELPEHNGINDHAIKLVDGQQPTYVYIYSLGLMELETLKTYIETNLAKKFIRPSKFPAGAPILFNQKLDSFLRLCVDYHGFNNLTIKNQYPFSMIGESLDELGRAKQFTQLDLISAYYWLRIRKEDKWKTTFRTRYGHFEYQVISFSWTNTLASFQGYIHKIFVEKLDIFIIVYLDSILIYIKDDGDGHVAAI